MQNGTPVWDVGMPSSSSLLCTMVDLGLHHFLGLASTLQHKNDWSVLLKPTGKNSPGDHKVQVTRATGVRDESKLFPLSRIFRGTVFVKVQTPQQVTPGPLEAVPKRLLWPPFLCPLLCPQHLTSVCTSTPAFPQLSLQFSVPSSPSFKALFKLFPCENLPDLSSEKQTLLPLSKCRKT